MSHQCSCHVQSSMARLILWCHISMMVLVSVTVDGMIIGNGNHLQLNILQDPAGSCSLQLDQQWQTIPSSPFISTTRLPNLVSSATGYENHQERHEFAKIIPWKPNICLRFFSNHFLTRNSGKNPCNSLQLGLTMSGAQL